MLKIGEVISSCNTYPDLNKQQLYIFRYQISLKLKQCMIQYKTWWYIDLMICFGHGRFYKHTNKWIVAKWMSSMIQIMFDCWSHFLKSYSLKVVLRLETENSKVMNQDFRPLKFKSLLHFFFCSTIFVFQKQFIFP